MYISIMKAAVIKEHGSFDKIIFEDRPLPIIQSTEEHSYVVKVKACGLNHLDTWVRRGVPGHRFPLPLVPGSDVTGVIESVNPCKNLTTAPKFEVGDKVIVNPQVFCGKCAACIKGEDHLCVKWGLMGETTDGGCQEYTGALEKSVFLLPASLSFEQGACIPINFVTAWEMLVNKAKIQKGETILIHAAGSGVSVACIQIAKLFGLQILVTSTSAEKLERAKALGAHRFINTSKSNFVEDVKLLTSKAGVDVVVDHVIGASFNDSVRSLKKGGRLVSCGATAGSEIKLDWKMIFFKNIALLGSTYGPVKVFEEVLSRFAKKELNPVIDSRYILSDLPLAHEALETRKAFGKIVVKFD